MKIYTKEQKQKQLDNTILSLKKFIWNIEYKDFGTKNDGIYNINQAITASLILGDIKKDFGGTI